MPSLYAASHNALFRWLLYIALRSSMDKALSWLLQRDIYGICQMLVANFLLYDFEMYRQCNV